MLTEAETRVLAFAYGCRLDEEEGALRWVATDELGSDLPELARLAERGWLERRKRHAMFRLSDEGLGAIRLGGILERTENVN
jgi:hypothetical protein